MSESLSELTSEEYVSYLPSESEELFEDSSEVTSEDSSEDSSEVIDYTESLTYISSGIDAVNTRLELCVTLGFIAISLFVSIIFFKIFSWFWKGV